MVWVGSMLVSALLLTFPQGGKTMTSARLVLSPVMGASMVAALAFGLAMAMETGWISERWVHAKLALAFGLAALHGVTSGQMRRLSAAAEPWRSPMLAYLPIAIGAFALIAINLAATKP